MSIDNIRETAAIRARYARIAPLYDLMEILPEWRFRSWRRRFWRQMEERVPHGGRALEVGVGTGKNIPYWPQGRMMSAVDLVPGMVVRARRRAGKLGWDASIEEGDAQALPFPDNSFDAAAATFVFCSVPDPVLGLRELARVVKAGGTVLLMEHVRSTDPLVGKLMDFFNPLVVRLMGPNINRDTVANVQAAGLEILKVEDLGLSGIFKFIEARVPGDDDAN